MHDPFGPGSQIDRRIVREITKMKKIVDSLRTLGLKIVLAQGSYDLVHIGHARYLELAKSHGDILVVGVDNDEKIRKRKGPERPVVPETERLEMVSHLRPVDLVYLKKCKDPRWQLIKTVCPDVLIATKDTYSTKEVKELKKYCAKVIVLERMATTSTSAKIRHLQIGTAQKLERALTPKLIKTLQEALLGIPNE